jgi:HEAT repeat protein
LHPNSSKYCFAHLKKPHREKIMEEEKETSIQDLNATPAPVFIGNANINLGNARVSGYNVHIGHNIYQTAPNSSPPIDHVLVLQRLQKSLRTRYQHYTRLERLFDNNQISIADSFINLALIKETEHKAKEQGLAHDHLEEKDDGEGREKPPNYVDERMASHEQLYVVKEPLALTELFESKDDTKTPNKILILGRAGIGKSVLCQYLATQWASDTTSFSADAKDEEVKEIFVIDYLQQKFDAVFWLKLRAVAARTTDRDTLLDVLNRFCLGGLKRDKPTQAELASYLETHTDKVLFILDGYDEITDRIEQPEYYHLNRILADIASQQHILLTSRPLTIDTLGEYPIRFDRRLENMGFLNENIEAYVHQFMHTAQKPEQAVQMLNFLKSHPGVWGIAHIPINLELLSWLWSKEKLNFGRGEIITLSKLYETIVEQVQKAYIRKTSKRPIALALDDHMESKREDRKISTVADRVNEFLEILAYSAMETETLFISATQIKIALEKTLIQHEHPSDEYHQEQLLKSATDKLGFLRAAGQCGKSQLDQEHYFIHLSFQEFYAAKYIARIFSQHPHGEENKEIFRRILTEKYTPRYQLMLWMSAGLLYQQGKKSQQFSSLLRFWRAILSQPRDIIGFHHMILVMHCLDECEADDRLALHKALISQQWEWFKIYAKKYSRPYGLYLEQLVRCPILLASVPMITSFLHVLKSRDDSLKSNVIKALAQLHNPSQVVIQALLSVLRNEIGDVMELAAKALGKLNNPNESIIQVLLAILEDKNEYIVRRKVIIEALGRLQNPSEIVVQALLRALRGKSDVLANAACATLSKLSSLSEAMIEVLISALQDKEETRRWLAIRVLISLKNPSEAVIKALLSTLQDEDPWVTKNVVCALGWLQNPSEIVIQALLRALQDKHIWVIGAAANALGNLNNPNEVVTEALLGTLRNENWKVRQAAVLGLRVKSISMGEALLDALQDKNELVRQGALSKLNNLEGHSDAVIKTLLSASQNEKKDVRQAANEALGKMKNPTEAVIKALLTALQDKEWTVKRAAIFALLELNNQNGAVVETLLSASQDEDKDIRQAANEALGKLKNPSEAVITLLLSALQDKEWTVKRAAIFALLELNNQSDAVILGLVDDFRNMREDFISLEKADKAYKALSKLKNPSEAVVKGLLDAFSDKEGGVRGTAIRTLLPTLEIAQAITLVFKRLVDDDQWNFNYWFEQNYLLFIDHRKEEIIARAEHRIYHIPLPPESLVRLEKQIIAVAKQENYPLEIYNLSGYNSCHAEKAILQGCEPDASICFVSDAMWLVHLVRKKISQRTLLIVEGITVEKDIMQCYEFTLSLRSGNPASGFFLPGSGIGCVLKTKNFLNLLEKDKKDYQCKTWDIDPATGQRLLRSLEAEASSSKMQRNDCFTWAEEKLKAIGLSVKGHWNDFNVTLPALVAEKAKITEPYNVRRNSEAEHPSLLL